MLKKREREKSQKGEKNGKWRKRYAKGNINQRLTLLAEGMGVGDIGENPRKILKGSLHFRYKAETSTAKEKIKLVLPKGFY